MYTVWAFILKQGEVTFLKSCLVGLSMVLFELFLAFVFQIIMNHAQQLQFTEGDYLMMGRVFLYNTFMVYGCEKLFSSFRNKLVLMCVVSLSVSFVLSLLAYFLLDREHRYIVPPIQAGNIILYLLFGIALRLFGIRFKDTIPGSLNAIQSEAKQTLIHSLKNGSYRPEIFQQLLTQFPELTKKKLSLIFVKTVDPDIWKSTQVWNYLFACIVLFPVLYEFSRTENYYLLFEFMDGDFSERDYIYMLLGIFLVLKATAAASLFSRSAPAYRIVTIAFIVFGTVSLFLGKFDITEKETVNGWFMLLAGIICFVFAHKLYPDYRLFRMKKDEHSEYEIGF